MLLGTPCDTTACPFNLPARELTLIGRAGVPGGHLELQLLYLNVTSLRKSPTR